MTHALNARPGAHPGHPPEELLIDAEVDDEPAPPAPPLRPWLLLLGLVLVALNLRPALSSLAPAQPGTRRYRPLGRRRRLLTTAPVLCLGLFAPLAPRLARRIGAERSVLLILFCLAGGIVLRSLFPVFGLFAGSVLAGASIGIIGVLLPGIVKRDFPRQAGVMTGVYTMALCLGAALAAAPPRRWRSSSATGNWRWRSGRCRRSSPPPSGCRRPARASTPIARPSVSSACGATRWPGRSRCTWACNRPGLHRLRLAAVDPDRPRHDCGGSRPGAVRLGDAATDHRPARALARRSRQGPARWRWCW